MVQAALSGVPADPTHSGSISRRGNCSKPNLVDPIVEQRLSSRIMPPPSGRSLSLTGRPAVSAYASNLEGVLETLCTLWVHGHVHRTNDYVIGRTKVVSNALGYPGRSRVSIRGLLLRFDVPISPGSYGGRYTWGRIRTLGSKKRTPKKTVGSALDEVGFELLGRRIVVKRGTIGPKPRSSKDPIPPKPTECHGSIRIRS
jgi:hypothetical protein